MHERQLGDWTLHQPLGAGGMGAVWYATTPDGQQGAVKLLNEAAVASPARLERELRLARQITSRRVAAPIAADLDSTPPWIAWEYCKGLTLAEHIERNGPLAGEDLSAFARQLAEGVRDLAAAGIVHRDLKPSNVMVATAHSRSATSPDVDGPQTGAKLPLGSVVIIDLGIATTAQFDTLTATSHVLGTPGWLTPEQLSGQRPTAAADVFNWATTVVYAATGHSPFGGETLAQLLYELAHASPRLDGLSDPLRRLVRDALAKEPSDRPSAAALVTRLLQIDMPPSAAVPGSPATAKLPGPSAVTQATTLAAGGASAPATLRAATAALPSPPPKRRRWPWTVVLLVLLAGAAAAALSGAWSQSSAVTAAEPTQASAPTDSPPSPTTTSEPTPQAAAAEVPTADDAPREKEPPTAAAPEQPATVSAGEPAPAPAADPRDYFSVDGSTPVASPDCPGLLGVCLSDPIERAVEMLGVETSRFAWEDRTYHHWDLDGVTLEAAADEIGSIRTVAVAAATPDVRITTPEPSIMIGLTTLGALGWREGNVISEEGRSQLWLWGPAGPAGTEAYVASTLVWWNDPATHADYWNGDHLEGSQVLDMVGDRLVQQFSVTWDWPEDGFPPSNLMLNRGVIEHPSREDVAQAAAAPA